MWVVMVRVRVMVGGVMGFGDHRGCVLVWGDGCA